MTTDHAQHAEGCPANTGDGFCVCIKDPFGPGKSMPEDHEYLSTACLHGLHERCRRTCKFCDTACICPCHAEDADCRACGQPLADHDRDDIGAGLVQYSCPEPEDP